MMEKTVVAEVVSVPEKMADSASHTTCRSSNVFERETHESGKTDPDISR